MKRKGLIIPLAIIVVLIAAYMMGPTMPKPEMSTDLPAQPANVALAEELVLAGEAGVPNIRPGNQSLLVWFDDSLKTKTEYCLLYLHGFSASPFEGNPVHVNFGKALGMNVYVPRLAGHGLITDDALLDMTPDNLWESAKEALVIARALGDKVIIMGTSTGGTLALALDAQFPDMVEALIMFSPNVKIYDKTASLLGKPWGLQIARTVMGGDHRVLEPDEETDDYWYNKYRVEALVYLQQLIDVTMTSKEFAKVTDPVFVGYYYKDEDNQDNTVSVPAIQWMYDNLSTPEEFKQIFSFPEAGAHVICNNLTSDSWMEVQNAAVAFARDILDIN
ncbi:MAG: alpha/beta fold hydrolase [Bacteroidales bacterium]|nr:alpha/beta fold hydrolase [Bacteroidales bacterium]